MAAETLGRNLDNLDTRLAKTADQAKKLSSGLTIRVNVKGAKALREYETRLKSLAATSDKVAAKLSGVTGLKLDSSGATTSLREMREKVDAATVAVSKLGTASRNTTGHLNKLAAAARKVTRPVSRIGTNAANAKTKLESSNSAVRKYASSLRDLGVSALATGDNLRAVGSGRVASSLGQTGTQVRELSKDMGSLSKRAGSAAAAMRRFFGTAVGVVAIRKTVGSLVEYRDAIDVLGGVSRKSGKELQSLVDAAVKASRESSRITPTEAIKGLTELTRAGFEATEAVKLLKPTADLARGGLISFDKASSLVTGTIRQFGLAAEDSTRVVDVLSEASIASNTTIAKMGGALTRTAASGKTFNIEIEEMVAALTQFADRNIQAEKSGTGLSRILLRLNNLTKEGKEKLAELSKEAGRSLNIDPAQVGIIKAMKELNVVQLDAQDATALVGKRFAELLLILRNTAGNIDEMKKRLDDASGAANDLAKVGREGLAAALVQIRSEAGQLIDEMGEGGLGAALNTTIRGVSLFFAELSGGTEDLQGVTEGSKAVSAGIAGITAALGGLIALKLSTRLAAMALGFKALATNIKPSIAAAKASTVSMTAMSAATGAMATTSTRAGVAVKGLSAALNTTPFGLIATLVGTAATAMLVFGDSTDEAANRMKKARENLEKSQKGYEDLSTKVREATAAQNALGSDKSLDLRRRELEALGKEFEEISKQVQALKLLGQDVPLNLVLATRGDDGRAQGVDAIGQIVEGRKEALDEIKKINAEIAKRVQEEVPLAVRAGQRQDITGQRAKIVAEFSDRLNKQNEIVKIGDDLLNAYNVRLNAVGEAFISPTKATEALRLGIKGVNDEAAKIGASVSKVFETGGLSASVQVLIKETEKKLALDRASAQEQEKAALIKALELKNQVKLNEEEVKAVEKLAEKVVKNKELVTLQRAQAREADRDRKALADSPKNLAALQRVAQQRLVLAKATKEQEIEIGETQKVQNALAARKITATKEEVQALIQVNIAAAKAEKIKSASARREAKETGRRQKLLRDMEQELQILQTIGAERTMLERKFQIENDLRARGIDITEKLTGENAKLAAEYEKIAKQVFAAEDARNLKDLRKPIEDERKALELYGMDREKFLLTLQVESELRAIGIDLNSKAGQSYLKLAQDTAELSRAQAELGALGAEAGAIIGNGFYDALEGAKDLDEGIENVIKSLGRLAFQKAVVNQLASGLEIAGKALAGIILGVASSGASNSSANNGLAQGAPRMQGGFMFDQGAPNNLGNVISSPTTFIRGGRRFSVAEGAGSTPEGVLPLGRNSMGELGVKVTDVQGSDRSGASTARFDRIEAAIEALANQSQNSGNVTMVMPSVRNSRDAREARATMSQTVRRALNTDQSGRRGRRPRGA